MKNLIVCCVLLFTTSLIAQNPFDYEGSHDISTGKTLFLSSNDANITIKGTDRSDVSVEIHRMATGNMAKKEKFDFDIEERGGNLYVTEKRVNAKMNFIGYLNIKYYTIDILLPHNVSLDIKGDDDNYDITNIDGNIVLTNEDGDVKIYDCRTTDIKIKSDDSNIDILNVNADIKARFEDGDLNISNYEIGTLDLTNDDGNIKLKSGTSKNTKIRTADGNIFLDVVLGDLDVTIDDGDIVVNEVHSKNLDIKGFDGDISMGVHLMSDSDYTIVLDDGDIDLELLGGGGQITVKCDDGDVKTRSRDFNITTDDDHYKVIEAGNGNGRVLIRLEDGDVRLGR